MPTEAELIVTLAISGRATHDMVGLVTIGRAPRANEGTTIQIDDDPLLSKSHLAINIDGGDLVITDLGSSNGTYVRDRAGEFAVPSDRWVPIPPGAEIEFGDQRLLVSRPTPTLGDDGTTEHDDDPTPERMLRPSIDPVTAALLASDDVHDEPPSDSALVDAPLEDSAPLVPSEFAKRGGVRTLGPFVAAAAVIGLVGFVLLRLMGGDGGVERGELSFVPNSPTQVWSVAVGGTDPSASIGTDSVYVLARVGDDAQLTSLGRADGTPRWSAEIRDADRSFVIDEFATTTVVQVCSFEPDGACRVLGFDNISGAELWSEEIGRGFAAATSAGVLVEANGVVSLSDAATGERITRVRGEIVFSDPNVILVRDRDEVAIYDDELSEVFSPVAIAARADAVTFDGSQIVALVDGQVEYVDDTGETSIEAQLGAAVTRVVALRSGELIVEQSGEVVVYDVANGDALERWAEPGTLGVVLITESGPVVIVDEGDDQHVVDLATGDVRFDIAGSRGGEVFTRPGSNLLLVGSIAPESGRIDVVSAREWLSGAELWSKRVDGRFAVDGALVVAGGDGDVTYFE